METEESETNALGADALMRSLCRMGVTDHRDLIERMCEMLGPEITSEVAAFYLDMNDWNLAAAVGFYLDNRCSPNSDAIISRLPEPPERPNESYSVTCLLRMCLSSVEPDKILIIRPGDNLEWSWNVKNNGDSTWPEGCTLRAVEDNVAFTILSSTVCPLAPGSSGNISVNFTAPTTSGPHNQLYRLCTPQGYPFGEFLCVRLFVESESQPNLQQQADSIMDYNIC